MESLIPASPAPLRLLMVGLNHRTAPLELRERMAFSAEQAKRASRQFRGRFGACELVILSTCNRAEIYLARPISAPPSVAELVEFFAEFHAISPELLHRHVYHHEDRAMAEHLFSVASSLDSMVVGETQILAQVKEAYGLAARWEAETEIMQPADGETGANAPKAAETSGRVLHGLFQRALAAAKDVHERTRISSGRLSIASVAVEVVASVFDRFDDKTVVCVGAGKMSALLLSHLRALKPGRLMVCNRSPERAQELAQRFSATARPFEALEDLLVEADVLLAGTGSAEPIITESRFRALEKRRRYRPIVIMDVAVPRDIDPAVAKLANVYLYNIDDLQEVAAGNRGRRDDQIAAAGAVLKEHVDEFVHWFSARDVGPIVRALYEKSHALARAELAIYFARRPELSEEERADLERLAHRLVGKMLHEPVKQLTTRGDATARPMLAEALRRLFGLGQEP